MFKKYILVLFIFCFTITVYSVTQSQQFLWKVTAEKAVVYLFGSIHVAQKEFDPITPEILDIYNNSDALVVEADILNSDEEMVREETQKKGLLSGGNSLKDLLPEELYKSVINRARLYRLDLSAINSTKPWLCALTLSMAQAYRLGYDSQYGIDLFFLNLAGNRKKIIELESVIYQIDLLNNFSIEEQIAFLESTLVPDGTARIMLKKIFKAWKKGDHKAMENLLFYRYEDEPAYHSFINRLLYKRNEEMVSKIETLLQNEGTYFVVIGAGHLVGEKSIISLLRLKGYPVMQQ